MAKPLRRTPLFPLYAAHGAKTIDFGGWEMPVQFEGILKEHDAVRTRAGLFDVSHMGELIVTGSGALPFLQRAATNDAAKLAVGMAQYSLLCAPDGGTIDDLLVYRLGDERYMLVVNAANIEKDLDWLRGLTRPGEDVAIEDASAETALLAVQGPAAADVVRAAAEADAGAGAGAGGFDPSTLRPFRFAADVAIRGAAALVSRTGYTGEDGFELYVPAERAADAWRALMDAGAAYGLAPCGLGARDTLRFEANLPLYGQELSLAISPLEAGLGAFVKFDKGDFVGRGALLAQREAGPPRRLVGVEMIDRGIPRPHCGVFDAPDGRLIGEVTSGTQSPTLKRAVGLALLDAAYAELGASVYVDVRGKRLEAAVVPTPFYRRRK
ncbi:glycine cleavage system aminomethyltransferase GcvT [Paenibacillus sp.]|uniref:glycine cleavage system aminomethyltransferase GcvT n=1 Tax=Paenibacillus sp. TaxID=58172 RepID=UPI002D5570C9|nr:glycine cleavage system aminomethyltransferase GcvT [Paenibacillus sp.]HZG87643.1 glycine cleavage system aminomethyltransferase GcvT [Paenibacillus sp.]